ncbi:hypothetical protein [Helicobacter rodentium]|uniref:hypothetical protein n=1 Tax=Helicobacter rodentium TaxID=59617 RepID=UPI0012EBACE5|nr:hypothetical protein [Helicobacter rodentium]
MNATLPCDDAMFAVPSLQGIKAVSNGTHRAGNCASLGRCYCTRTHTLYLTFDDSVFSLRLWITTN